MNLDRIVICLKELGYSRLTDLQRRSIVELNKGNRSLIIVAPTGSGKTEAAAFPVMLRTAVYGKRPVTAIYITPLRALNRDIERRLKHIGECFNLDVAIRHGDTPVRIRKSIAQNPPHILITTPETLNYVVINDEMRKYLQNLEYVVIDEYRDLLESKRGLLLLTTLHLLELYFKKNIIKVALTATLREDSEAYRFLSSKEPYPAVVLRDPALKKFEIKVVVPTMCKTELCREIYKHVYDEELASRLESIVKKAQTEGYVLLFTNTRSLAESLGTLLKSIVEDLKLEVRVDVHHGSLSRTHREKVEKEFRERRLNLLVSTSSLELGIDIGHVEYVIQYMSPRQVLRLVQRIGRSKHRLGDVSRGMIIVPNNALHILEALVLARRACEGVLEHEVVVSKPMDVLAYAIALYTLLNPDGASLSKLYEDLRNQALYEKLQPEELQEVVEYLAYAHVIKAENGRITPTRKTRLYVYKVSMIPATKEVHVVDVTSNGKVGALDEEYVVVNLDEGSVIVLAGKPWKTISYNEKESKLYVEPTKVSVEEAIIPYWEGENIPVEHYVAQEVGEVIKYIKEHHDLPEDLRRFLELENATNIYESIAGLGDRETIYVDYVKEPKVIVINVYGGSKVNALIRDLIKYVLKVNYPFLKFQAHSTPYAVYIRILDPDMIEFSQNVVNTVFNVIRGLHNFVDRSFVERIAKESSLYLWRIYQVGQRFGAISPETTSISRKLLEAFTDTIIGKEALREVLLKDYDVNSFAELAKRISKNEVKVELRSYDKLADHHITLLKYIETPLIRELITLNISNFLEKLLNRRISVLCLKCDYYKEDRVKEILKLSRFSCPNCGYATLTLVKGDASEELKLIRKLKRGEKLTSDEAKMHMDLVERAILLYKHGDKAVLALSTLGVGTQEAARIINKVLSGSDLATELYESEIRFFKIKKYLRERDK